jgi:putative ABC transport system permease protein
VRLGVKSLLLHKLRSILTMLGIIFGVCSVIAMLAIGEGASYEAQEAIKRLGSDNIIIRSVKPAEEVNQAGGGRGILAGLRFDLQRRSSYPEHDPGVRHVLPLRIIRETIQFDQNRLPGQVIGTPPLYPSIVGWKSCGAAS